MWEFLSREMPEEFEQSVVRRPVFRRMDGIRAPGAIGEGWRGGMCAAPEEESEGEGEGGEERTSKTEHRTSKIEGATQDPLTPTLSPAYGGEGEEVEHGGEGEEPRTIPREREFADEMQHIGWMWVCPGCGKEARTIYYPVAVRTLFDYGEFDDPVIKLRLCDADLPRAPLAMFACWRCHDVCHYSSISKNAWNQAVSHLTAGMLYGSEVEKPASFVAERK